mgnify:FL=1
MLFEKANGILDLREREAYQAAHLQGSTWLELTSLPESLNALPASPAILYLVGSKEQIEEASLLLDSKGYQINGSLAVDSLASMQQWSEQLPGKVISGKDSKTLWQACPLVQSLMDSIKMNKIVLPCSNERPTVLDVGCGGGRDAIFMAKQKMNVIAIDHEAKVLKRAKSLANMSGAQIKFKCCDIKKTGCLPAQTFDLITMVRFLNRDLFDYIKGSLKPGGVVLIETFVDGVEKLGNPKNPQFILNKGELAEVFADFTIFVDKIAKLPDGRPVNSFIAQKT